MFIFLITYINFYKCSSFDPDDSQIRFFDLDNIRFEEYFQSSIADSFISINDKLNDNKGVEIETRKSNQHESNNIESQLTKSVYYNPMLQTNPTQDYASRLENVHTFSTLNNSFFTCDVEKTQTRNVSSFIRQAVNDSSPYFDANFALNSHSTNQPHINSNISLNSSIVSNPILNQTNKTEDFNFNETSKIGCNDGNEYQKTQDLQLFSLTNSKCHQSLQPKEKLKRKNSESSVNLFNSSLKSDTKKNKLIKTEKPKRTHYFLGKKQKLYDNFDLMSKEGFQYTILTRFESFIEQIENLLKIYLDKMFVKENDINNILYMPELCFLEGFSEEVFSKCNKWESLTLKKVSTTTNMLCKFINFVDFERNNKLMICLNICFLGYIELPTNNVDLAKTLLSEILKFLKSEESNYLKSICTELYSFVHLYDKLEIERDDSVVKAFSIFLLLVKRNSMIIFKLKKSLLNYEKIFQKTEPIKIEKNCSSAFIYAFINNLKFNCENYIEKNLSTSILFNCIAEKIKKLSKKKAHIQIANISRNFFFIY